MAHARLVLAAPVRTPIGKFGGALATLSAADLGTAAAGGALARAGLDPAKIDQVIFGHGRQAGGGPNTARQIGWRAGVPQERPAYTINQACGSGLQAILSAARAILLGEAEVVLAGGTESMSNTPYLLPRMRWGYRMGHAEIVDGMYKDGFNDPALRPGHGRDRRGAGGRIRRHARGGRRLGRRAPSSAARRRARPAVSRARSFR